MKFLKHIALFLISLTASYLVSPWAGVLYQNVTGDHGSWTDVSGVFGLVIAYIFFTTLLFTAFGGKHKHFWIGLLLIPAIIFELYFDASHFYFPLALGILAWAIGHVLLQILRKFE